MEIFSKITHLARAINTRHLLDFYRHMLQDCLWTNIYFPHCVPLGEGKTDEWCWSWNVGNTVHSAASFERSRWVETPEHEISCYYFVLKWNEPQTFTDEKNRQIFGRREGLQMSLFSDGLRMVVCKTITMPLGLLWICTYCTSVTHEFNTVKLRYNESRGTQRNTSCATSADALRVTTVTP